MTLGNRRLFIFRVILSDGGGRLFFQSPDALGAAVIVMGLLDVYEWERPGVGSCTEASAAF